MKRAIRQTNRFSFEELEIPGMLVIHPQPIHDNRGYFMRVYSDAEMAEAAGFTRVCEENQSSSSTNVVRGLHVRRDLAESKIVRAISGTIFDVVVDLRRDSPTFLKWCGRLISAENGEQILVPPGCAHGFQALTDAIVCYGVDVPYDQELDVAISWCDETIGVKWPRPTDAIVSTRDAEAEGILAVLPSLAGWSK